MFVECVYSLWNMPEECGYCWLSVSTVCGIRVYCLLGVSIACWVFKGQAHARAFFRRGSIPPKHLHGDLPQHLRRGPIMARIVIIIAIIITIVITTFITTTTIAC